MEQPSLGSAYVGADAISLGLDWSWEQDWSARLSVRLSGSTEFTGTCQGAMDAAELHAWVSDRLAEVLGLV